MKDRENEYDWEELEKKYEIHQNYQARLQQLLEEEAAQKEAELRGFKEGRARGIEEGRIAEQTDTALRLLLERMDIQFVQKITELPLEKITEIKGSL